MTCCYTLQTNPMGDLCNLSIHSSVIYHQAWTSRIKLSFPPELDIPSSQPWRAPYGNIVCYHAPSTSDFNCTCRDLDSFTAIFKGNNFTQWRLNTVLLQKNDKSDWIPCQLSEDCSSKRMFKRGLSVSVPDYGIAIISIGLLFLVACGILLFSKYPHLFKRGPETFESRSRRRESILLEDGIQSPRVPIIGSPRRGRPPRKLSIQVLERNAARESMGSPLKSPTKKSRGSSRPRSPTKPTSRPIKPKLYVEIAESSFDVSSLKSSTSTRRSSRHS